ncbi:hypothetical protein BDR26DRAFT_859341 [Obelidium mucronatum]|nr:hypothetical protein BDR26DRAFT_859341 [Obelidium mucronatum]
MATPTTSSNCFSIDGTTKTMPDFIGYPLFIDQQNMVTDTASLDAFILKNMDDNLEYQKQFQSNYDCPGWMGQSQRFHSTYFQGMLTLLAQNNKNPCTTSNKDASRFVCQSSCEDAKMSLSFIFGSSQFCNQSPNQDVAASRSSTLTAYDTVCVQLPRKDCIDVVSSEKNQAGFPKPEDASLYCNPGGPGNMINDPLCGFVAFDQNAPTIGGNMTKSNSSTRLRPGAMNLLVSLLCLIGTFIV